MTCNDCHEFSTTIDYEFGVIPYCFKKDSILTDEFCLQEHIDCCVCDGRYDGRRDGHA